MSEWINVNDRLPEKDTVCVVWNEKRPFQYYISLFSEFNSEFEVSQIGASRLYDPICFNATYWMPLTYPTEKKDET